MKIMEDRGCTIAEFVNASRFNLAICEQIREELEPIVSKPGIKFILDLKSITFMDSSGIGCVIALMKIAKQHGSCLKLCNMADNVREIFELLKLHTILDIREDRENCIQAFSA